MQMILRWRTVCSESSSATVPISSSVQSKPSVIRSRRRGKLTRVKDHVRCAVGDQGGGLGAVAGCRRPVKPRISRQARRGHDHRRAAAPDQQLLPGLHIAGLDQRPLIMGRG